MDADLSRRAAALFNTPYWRYLFSQMDSAEYSQMQADFVKKLTEARTFDNLDEASKHLFMLGEASSEIKSSMPNASLEEIIEQMRQKFTPFPRAQAGNEESVELNL